MPAQIGVRVLLVSNDIQTIDTLCDHMGRMTMHVEVCADTTTAIRKLCHSKFEGVVIDFHNQEEALRFIKQTRELTSHKAAIVLAVLNDDAEMPSAFRAGASFVLMRPLTTPVLMRTLRAAYPLMLRERRRSFRYPVQTAIYLASGSGTEMVATSDNISEDGLAVSGAPLLRVGERVALRLVLPGREAAIKLNAEVCWSDNAGRAGLEFLRVQTLVKEQLVSWLSDRLDELLVAEALR